MLLNDEPMVLALQVRKGRFFEYLSSPNPKNSNDLSSTNTDLPRHLYVVGIIGQIKFSLFVQRDKLISLKLYVRQEGFAKG